MDGPNQGRGRQDVASIRVVLLVAVVAMVGITVVPAHAARPVAYAPWVDDQTTYRPDGNGVCLSYDDIRLRLTDAAAKAARLYPSADVSRPDPRAVAAYRASTARVSQDIAGMSTECRVTLAWQVRTLVKHLALRDRGIYVSKDGRLTMISSTAPCDIITASTVPMDNLMACDPDLERMGQSLEQTAANERQAEISACACDATGVAWDVWQRFTDMRTAVVAVAAATILASAAYPGSVTLPQVRDMLVRMGVVFSVLERLSQMVYDSLSRDGAGSGAAPHDGCGCGGDK